MAELVYLCNDVKDIIKRKESRVRVFMHALGNWSCTRVSILKLIYLVIGLSPFARR